MKKGRVSIQEPDQNWKKEQAREQQLQLEQDRVQEAIKCRVKIYKIANSMQRCPYIHEMRERLLADQDPPNTITAMDQSATKHHGSTPTPPPPFAATTDANHHNFHQYQPQQQIPQQPVATVVKLNPDGYGSHTSPTRFRADRAPLVSSKHVDDDYVDLSMFPKNAKTSLFIIMSFVYAKLLIVVCIAYVISDVVTHNIPLYYYEGFFTYLYGMSIFFLLYVFCFLLQESSCCSGSEKQDEKVARKAALKKSKEKEKERKKEEERKKKEEKERLKKEKKEKEKEKDREKKEEKDKDKKSKKQQEKEQSNPVAAGVQPPPVVTAINNVDVEVGTVAKAKRKRKTTQNDQSHGSFFLRIGAIAFGLGTMIYNGLEFGAFFEVPFTSPCYMILRGVNPVLQMVFTFMQMYFIFMNSRLNIHRFKVIARFGLMHVVATNICVWIRTLVLEYLKEITIYHRRYFNNADASAFADRIRLHNLRNANTVLGSHKPIPDAVRASAISANAINTTPFASLLRNAAADVVTTTKSTITNMLETNPTLATTKVIDSTSNGTEVINNIVPQALIARNNTWSAVGNLSCGRVNIMGNIVQDSAPYLFPFIIEYSLIGAAVIYVMWKHIGRNPRFITQEDLEHRLEVMLSRRAVAMAHAQQGRVDCVGASKGLFFGLLLLVGSLICLILFFVLIHHPELGLLAIYLADVSHCVLMGLSILAIIIGFIRVQSLKFKTEEQSDLNDILLRVSAFGLFIYATFSVIAGHLNAFTREPNLLVMITGALSILQVVLQLLFIADVSRRRVYLPEHDRSKPGRQVVTFLLICNVTMWIIYTFEMQKVEANPVQLEFYGFLAWAIVQRVTLPLCIFHRFHSAVTLAEIWKTSYKARLE